MGKRRRGNRSNTSTPVPQLPTEEEKEPEEAKDDDKKPESEEDKKQQQEEADTTVADGDKEGAGDDNTTKPDEDAAPAPAKEDESSNKTGEDFDNSNSKEDGDKTLKNDSNAATTSSPSSSTSIPDLVLTSEKRRGVYECDYCHSDISQLPRIRCAVCPDFDLCLDCFATTDHTAAVARIKAAATAHSELAADGITATSGVMASAALNHRADHGYRVCDSTRYPIFALTRSVSKRKEAPAVLSRASTPIPTQPTSTAAKPNEETAKTREEGEDKKDEDEKDTDMMEIDVEDKKEDEEDTKMMDADEQQDEEDEKKSAAAPEENEFKSKVGDASEAASTAAAAETATTATTTDMFVIADDPKTIWTAEEDLRLIDAIKTHGLGNWGEISEAVAGNGSIGKTPRRCMERYFDDYLGRYGHILPPYVMVDDASADDNDDTPNASAGGDQQQGQNGAGEDEAVRASKRKIAVMMRSSSNISAVSSRGGSFSKKRYKVIPTESIPGYENLWPNPYMPPIPTAKLGQEVARDLSSKAENAFVKAISSVQTKEEAETIRKEWMETKMNQVGSPTVLPPRPEDSEVLPGADLVGFMPRRGEFDIEWENEAESALADMEFLPSDSQQDKDLKVQVLEIYYQKQEERERRKKFILSRNLFDYRKQVKKEGELPADERDLVHRMRLFERFHTPEEHKKFIDDILKAKRLRKEIAKLQMYRRIGIRSLAEAEMYELDKKRRQFHKEAYSQKVAEAGEAKTASLAAAKHSSASATAAATSQSGGEAEAKSPAKEQESLWKQYSKQYRTSDRKARRSINRADSNVSAEKAEKPAAKDNPETPAADSSKQDKTEQAKQQNEAAEPEEPPKPKEDGEAAKLEESSTSKEKEQEKKPEDENKTTSEPAEAADGRVDEEKQAGDESKTAQDDAKKEEEKEDDKMDFEEKQEGSKMDIDNDEAEEKKEEEEEKEFDISKSKGYDLLSKREVALCVRLNLVPLQYLEIKKALIFESLHNGLLESGNGRRTVMKVDIERRGNVLDFMVRAGWISSTLASTARTIETAPGQVASGVV